MEQIIELLVVDIEVVVEEELPQLRNPNQPSFEVVDLLEGLVRFDVLNLFANHLNNSKAFEYLDDQRYKVSFDLCCESYLAEIEGLHLSTEWKHLV